MREALGFPESVAGVSVNEPFYSAILNYRQNGQAYAVTYEPGIDAVPRFDSNLTIYGTNKTVSIQYDTPYIKGLPIKVHVDEENEYGEVMSKTILSNYEDAYTTELKELHGCILLPVSWVEHSERLWTLQKTIIIYTPVTSWVKQVC